MRRFSRLLVSLWLTSITAASTTNSSCIPHNPVPLLNGSQLQNYGIVLFPAFEAMDAFGPADLLQLVSLQVQKINLFWVAENLQPVSTALKAMNPFGSNASTVVVPTHTFRDDLDLDVLIVPGGPGVRATEASLAPVTEYLQKMFPRVKILMTVCTGSGLAARAGILDRYAATTNKHAWNTMTGYGPDVSWVSPARYVVDGKVWTSSGVTAGIDLTFQFIESYWGTKVSESLAGLVEHVPLDSRNDPFADYYGIPPTLPLCT